MDCCGFRAHRVSVFASSVVNRTSLYTIVIGITFVRKIAVMIDINPSP